VLLRWRGRNREGADDLVAKPLGVFELDGEAALFPTSYLADELSLLGLRVDAVLDQHEDRARVSRFAALLVCEGESGCLGVAIARAEYEDHHVGVTHSSGHACWGLSGAAPRVSARMAWCPMGATAAEAAWANV
jgi:hypothetical protein